MGKTLDNFFEDNDVRIGKDFEVIPPIYYQSLNEGMRSYYETIADKKQSIALLILHDDWSREAIAFSFGNPDATVSTILGLHRFFELLLKDILSRIDPFLAVKFLENEKQVIDYLNGSLSAENVQTIEFSEANKRIKAAIKYAKENPTNDKNQIALKFEFLIADDTMIRLATWRNRIIHNGKTLPNIFALDFLVTQRIMPLIKSILDAEKDILKNYTPHYFNTPSGIDLLDEFLKIEFSHNDFYLNPKTDKLKTNLFRIAHLKELGRGRFYFDPLLPNNRSYTEPYYEKALDRCFRFAESEKQNEHFHDIKKCPCCGIKTLVVYKKMTRDLPNFSKSTDYYFSKCTSCEYLLPENMGEPSFFGLHTEHLFR
ncbi:MAG: hypothetical protein IPM74_03755 [Crocinitomicaceae bacterium]|nr:hypothetical protein [Crocinitomicaceae bacterium]MBK8925029.1 hypothetical protein [Crocinitomicaceae bacterium]